MANGTVKYTKIGMRILFLNNPDLHCGVADYGRRLYAILSKHFDIDFVEVDKDGGFIYTPGGYDIFLYNYHYATMPFLTNESLKKFPGVKHICIFHEAHLSWTPDAVIDTSIRPLIEDIVFPADVPNPIPIIGSFGFGFPDKNFPRICEEVAAQYDEAVIRLNIPFAYYGDRDGQLAKRGADKCREILKGTKIQLEISHEFLPGSELIQWLRGNNINLFLYKQSHGRGIASATDYALSAYRPIGVSNSEMFRHLPASVCIDNTPIKELNMQQLLPVYEQHSNKRLVDKFREALNG